MTSLRTYYKDEQQRIIDSIANNIVGVTTELYYKVLDDYEKTAKDLEESEKKVEKYYEILKKNDLLPVEYTTDQLQNMLLEQQKELLELKKELQNTKKNRDKDSENELKDLRKQVKQLTDLFKEEGLVNGK